MVEWHKDGTVAVQVSKKILPFYVELTTHYTEYSLLVAMSLKSKWSQRLYELCAQWRSAGGFRIAVKELRVRFMLEDEYEKYASFKKYVLDVAHNELKKLYDAGQSDLYFEYSEDKKGRSVETLIFKIISKSVTENTLGVSDYDYMVRTELNKIYETDKHPKNKEFVGKTMVKLRLDPGELERCYKKIEYVKRNIPKEEWAPYLRYVIKKEFLKRN